MPIIFGPFSAVLVTTNVSAVSPFCKQPVMVCSFGAGLSAGLSCASAVTDSANTHAAINPEIVKRFMRPSWASE